MPGDNQSRDVELIPAVEPVQIENDLPISPEDWNNRGARRFLNGDLQGAAADLTNALQLQPDYPEAQNNRGLAARVLQRFSV